MKPVTVLTRWLCLALVAACFGTTAFKAVADSSVNPWQSVAQVTNPPGTEIWVQPAVFRAVTLNHAILRSALRNSPKASMVPAGFSRSELALPMPDGTLSRFRIVESSVMAPELAAKFPEIKTYLGQGIDDPAATVRFDTTPAGFHAQILSPNGAVYVDPHFRGDTNAYVCYYKRDYLQDAVDFACFTEGGETKALSQALVKPAIAAAGTLRTYRLAVAATGEYTAYQGGTVSAGMAAIVTAINRVTGVYQSEVGIQLQLVANNNLIIYTNGAMDPYSNGNQTLLLSQNQSNIDAVIGSANYDIGHVFSTAGGGLATVGCVCVNGLKARGETGKSAPTGDAFYIDYVAHEMGHQFGAYHTFNSTTSSCGGGNRTAGDAYEPGSGSTIMAYAGICGSDNLQAHSDPYFHSASLDEIITYISSGSGSGCAVTSATGNNAPTVSAGISYTIPKGTPFQLTATGSDPDADALTYCWEERDLGPSAGLSAPDNGASPLFRSFNPVSSPVRTFPRMSDILGNVTTSGETVPATGRIMNFRVVARDNRAGGGGVATSDMQVTVTSNAGPFSVTMPATAVTWSNLQTVTWNVAGTTSNSINATNVNILLSTNGGTTFPITLASNVANSGSRSVQLPSVSTSQARIEVQAANNIFFAISRSNFTIVPSSSDLAVGVTASTNLLNVGENVTLTINVTNLGSLTAGGVVVTSSFPASLSCIAAGCSVGTCTTNSQGCNCALGLMTNGARGTITLVMRALVPGYATNAVSVTSAANDPVSFNNFAAATVTINSSPTISSISSQVAAEDSSTGPIPLTIFDADVSPDMLTLTGVALDTNLIPNSGIVFGGSGSNRTVTIIPAAHHYGATTITLSVSDGVASTNTSFALTVTQSNHAPVLAAVADVTILETMPFGFTNAATDVEVPVQLLTFSLSNAPAGAVINPTNGVFTWTPSESQGPATNIVTIIVTDSGSPPLSDSKAFTVVVLESNLPPVLTLQSNRAVVGLASVVVTNTAADPDIPTNTLTYILAAGPTNAVIDTNGIISWAPTSAQVPSTNLFTTVVTDSNSAAVNAHSLSATNSFLVVVQAVHNGPALGVITNHTIAELTMLVVTNTGSDGDLPSLELSYHLENAPTNAAIDTNGVIRWTPTEAQGPSTNIFTTVVTDSGSPALSATNVFSVIVEEVNVAPVLPLQSDKTLAGLASLVVTNTASDADIPSNTLTYILEGPTNAVIDMNGVITWTPDSTQVPSTNSFVIIVTDNNPHAVNASSLSATNSFLVVVSAVHNGPVLPAIGEQFINELSALTLTNTASDSDVPALNLTYELVNAPDGAAIDTNGVIHWTPQENQAPGTYDLVTIVTDAGSPSLSATNHIIVEAREINTPPQMPDQTNRVISGLITLSVTNTAFDADVPANILTYTLTSAPTNAVIDTNGIITWTPVASQAPSTNYFETVVVDYNADAVNEPNLSATNSFVVIVEPVRGPVLPVQIDRSVDELSPLVVTNTATDSDTPPITLTYGLMAPPAGATIDTNGIIRWTPSQAQAGTTNLIVTVVSDDGSPMLSATNSFTVVVNDLSGRVPMLTMVGDRTVTEGETLVVTNTATGPGSDSEPLTYGLSPDAPSGATINVTNGVFVWTPTEEQGPSTNLITVILTNGAYGGYISTQSFTVTVLESNLPPVLTGVADRIVHAGMVVTITNQAADPDVPANVLSFDLQPGAPPSATLASATGVFTWATTDADVNTTNVITIKVTDDGLPKLSDTRSFTITVVLRPEFTQITRTNTQVSLTWSAIPGLSYELQYKDPNTSTLWTNLQTVVATEGGTASGTDSVDFFGQRLYRVRVVP